ncbi:MAG: carboxypeptidase-like regulatory domain-containing protein, partial [Planctomycetota bacterium]
LTGRAPLHAGEAGGWQDPDADQVARVVAIYIARLDDPAPRAAAEARERLTDLGLAALPAMRRALQNHQLSAAARAALEPIVARLDAALVVTVHDPYGRPVTHVPFDVILCAPSSPATSPGGAVPATPPSGVVRRAATDGAGRLVLSDVQPTTNTVILQRGDLTPVDGLGRVVAGVPPPVQGQPWTLTAVVPAGVVPQIKVVSAERHRPVPYATVFFVPADAATAALAYRRRDTAELFAAWLHNEPNPSGDLDPATGLPRGLAAANPAAAAELTGTRLWNPFSALESGLGACSPRTDAEGLLQAGRLPPGRYALHIRAPGYAPLLVPDFVLPVPPGWQTPPPSPPLGPGPGAGDPPPAAPTLLTLTPLDPSFAGGAVEDAAGQPLAGALVFLVPEDPIYDAAHVTELADFEQRQRVRWQADQIHAGKTPVEIARLTPPAAPVGFTACTVPPAYLAELRDYPQVRLERVQPNGRLEFRHLAPGRYRLRVFCSARRNTPPDPDDPAGWVEWVPAADQRLPLVVAPAGGAADLKKLQYKRAAPAEDPSPPPAAPPGNRP